MPRAKIEQKHIYNNSQQILSGIFRSGTNISNNDINPNIVYVTRPTYPIQGVEDNQRIGRKITSTSVVIEGYISLFNHDTEVQNSPGAYEVFNEWVTSTKATRPLNEPCVNLLKVGVRQFIIEVDPDFVAGLTPADLQHKFLRWFNDLVIYTDSSSTQVANSTFVKRESTSYTGQFKILLDKHYILSQKSPQVHFQHTINYKRDLNFDGTGSPLPTNKVLYMLTFGPTNVMRDYYNHGFSLYLTANQNEVGNVGSLFYVAQCNCNVKLNYIDL